MRQDLSGTRTRCFLKASIVFNNRMSSIDCIIRNLSVSGARIEVDGSIAIPQVFDLEISGRNVIYHASVRWRDIDSVGVDFISDGEEPNAQSMLAAENRELRHKIEVLMRQLQSSVDA